MTALLQAGWRIAVDFAVLTTTLYLILTWAKEARALRIVVTIAILHTAAVSARHMALIITSTVLEGAAIALGFLLLILFQPELRRALMRIENRLRFRPEIRSLPQPASGAIGTAVFSMSLSRSGALIVFPGEDSIEELIESGITVDSEITVEMIEAIFQKSSPMHDGAIVVEGNRITKAKVVLPLTHRANVPTTFGTRHRAAMGLAEASDAMVVVVSEEDGAVRVARGGEVNTLSTPEEFVQVIYRGGQNRARRWMSAGRRIIASQIRLKAAAAVLAMLICTVSFVEPATRRTVMVPVEFSNLPRTMEIADVSRRAVQVEMRGGAWVLDSVDPSQLVAALDLSNVRPGQNSVRIRPEILRLPPGISVDLVLPSTLDVRLDSAVRPASTSRR
jgi:uncharacterized protein (TIGR00159 family)